MTRSRAPRSWLLALLIGASLALHAPAFAQSTAQSAAQSAAQGKRFAAAQKLYDAGAFTPALAEFKALAAETGSPNAELYYARCLRELGRLPEAYEAMTTAVRDATARAESEPKYATTRNTAAADLALLEPKVGKVLIAVANPPAGLTVTLGGAPLAVEKLGIPVAVAIGDVAIHLKAPGHKDIERRVTLRGGELSTVTVTLEAASASPVTPPPPVKPVPAPPSLAPRAPRAPSPGLGAARGAGIAVLGVGVGGMVTFGVAGLMANQRYSSVDAACGSKRCTDPKYTAEISGGKQLDLIANIGLGVGVAGLAGGTLLLVLGKPSKSAARVGAWAAPEGGGLTLRGGF